MIDHNTRRVFLSFLIIVFLTFYPCFRQVSTSDSSEGDTMTIVLTIVFIIIINNIVLFYCFSHVSLVPNRSHVITLREL
jgi:hypothetical protein